MAVEVTDARKEHKKSKVDPRFHHDRQLSPLQSSRSLLGQTVQVMRMTTACFDCFSVGVMFHDQSAHDLIRGEASRRAILGRSM